MKIENDYRKWHFTKTISLPMFAAFLLQFGAIMWHASTLANQLHANTEEIKNLAISDKEKKEMDEIQNLKISDLESQMRNSADNFREIKGGLIELNRKFDQLLYVYFEKPKGR
jgi:hypothetical protein